MPPPSAGEAPPLRLLGAPSLTQPDGSELCFRAERPYQLLALLACRRQWLSRDELAELLWPDRGESLARSNLRKVLLRARELAAARPGLPGLEEQGHKLRWLPDSDLSRFEQALAVGDAALALALYRGPLLEGLDDGLAGACTDWLTFERRRIAAARQGAAATRLAALADRPDEAAALAEALWRDDPGDDTFLLALARLRAGQQRSSEALALLEDHAQRCRDEWGIEPSAELRQLTDQLRGTRPAAAAADGGAAEPAAPQRFIGRRIELAQALSMLEQPGCRLLTLIGPGGIGKTALARAVQQARTPGQAGGAGWVALGDLADAAQVPARIAAALDTPLSGTAEPWRDVAAAIGPRAMLLVLDNAEHLAALADPLARLLAACPRLQLLAASRGRLGVEGEWLLPLEGLPLPDADETDPEVLDACDSVRLFVARARAARHGFDLAAQAADVVALLHAVDGLPLAIELLASWVRLLPVREVHAELRQSLDVLDSHARPDRGLRASFLQSWHRLAAAQRTALATLACLPGDFDREMAKAVAGCTLPMLASLVDGSLVRADGSGSFALHPLIRRCAFEQADAGACDVPAVRERHAGHVGLALAAFEDDPARLQRPAGLAQIERLLPHAREAWSWANEHRRAGLVSRLAVVMTQFYRLRGMWPEGLAMLERSTAALGEGDAAELRARAIAMRNLGLLQFHAGRPADGEQSAAEALRLAGAAGHRPTLIRGHVDRANCLVDLGRNDDAAPHYEQALALAEAEAEPAMVAIAGVGLGSLDYVEGRYDDASRHFRLSADAFRRDGNADALAASLNNLGNVHQARHDSAAALAAYHEALAVCDAHGLASARPFALVNIALVHLNGGKPGEALPWLERALDDSRQHGEPIVEAASLRGLAEVAAARGDRAAASRHLADSLVVAGRAQSPPMQLASVLVWARMLAADGRSAQATMALRWLLEQPGAQADLREEAAALAATLPDRQEAPAGELADGTHEGVIAMIHAELAAGTDR